MCPVILESRERPIQAGSRLFQNFPEFSRIFQNFRVWRYLKGGSPAYDSRLHPNAALASARPSALRPPPSALRPRRTKWNTPGALDLRLTVSTHTHPIPTHSNNCSIGAFFLDSPCRYGNGMGTGQTAETARAGMGIMDQKTAPQHVIRFQGKSLRPGAPPEANSRDFVFFVVLLYTARACGAWAPSAPTHCTEKRAGRRCLLRYSSRPTPEYCAQPPGYTHFPPFTHTHKHTQAGGSRALLGPRDRAGLDSAAPPRPPARPPLCN